MGETDGVNLPLVLAVVEEFRSLLWNRYGPQFKGLVLYGSQSRGDSDSESDVDLLVLMGEETDVGTEQKGLHELSWKLNSKHLSRGFLLSPVLVREGEYQRGKSPFFLNVKREGISFAAGDRIDMQPEIDDLMERARRNLGIARRLAEDEDYDVSASRAYYAMFYAAEAALLARGMARSRHSGVVAAFNEFFVNTGLLPPNLAGTLDSSFRQRNLADYGREPFPQETAEAMLRDAEELVDAVAGYLAA